MRLPAWESRLTQMMDDCRDEPFAYGSMDCFQLARHAILAMTDIDIAARFQPYDSFFGYSRQMLNYCRSASLLTFADQLMAEYGFRGVPIFLAQRGDILMSREPAFAVMALHGRTTLMLTEQRGIVERPMAEMVRAWRI